MLRLHDGARWVTGSEAARLAGISEHALRKRRTRETPEGRHPEHVAIGPNAVLYRLSDFTAYVATWADTRPGR